MDFPSIDMFAKSFGKYPFSIVSVYQLYRDLTIKNELHDINIVDGLPLLGIEQYIIEGLTKSNEKRILITFQLDSNIDLIW